MNVQVITKENVKTFLDKWYLEIRMQNVESAKELKKELEVEIENIKKNQDLMLYYSLLRYRYAVLDKTISIDTDKIQSLDIPKDSLMEYYYYFFRASHETSLGNYKKAKELYEKAETNLKYIPDELEEAEFYVEYAIFYSYIHQPLMVIEHVSKAKAIFSKHIGYEFKIASCYDVLGHAYIQLKRFEHAEMHLITSMDIIQKRNNKNDENFILRTTHNLGYMYSEQNRSKLAIRYLSEVTKKMPNHFRTIFLEARENFKLGETKVALKMIEKGMKVSKELDQEEYEHHFTILKAIIQEVPVEELEKIIAESFIFFEEEGLWQYVLEYSDILAVQLYENGHPLKAGKYFYLAHKGRKEAEKKGL
ncbi:tetratricopeptide repeat protein [Bacillus sp. NPDC094077]|uniref:response regulator aspartate phosphatase n=1 Tax=Bacillus sp. NPDC094077 TaxID=3390932 RepID=UPI003D01E9E7